MSGVKLSVVTINYNNEKGLRKTLDSFLLQKRVHPDLEPLFEHIIVDGGSQDESAVLIEEYCNKAPYRVKWVSERDEGIYNAMNKGTRMAAGDYLLFLNSGDSFANDSVLEKLLSQELVADVIIGRVNVVSGSTVISRGVSIYGNEIGLFGLLLKGIPHQGTLIQRQLQIRHPYDEGYKINSDLKFFLETIILENCSVQYLPITIADYDNDGISARESDLQQQERSRILRSLIPARICKEYEEWVPHYNELIRVKWLLGHPFFYKVYRAWTSLGRRILGYDDKRKS